MNNFTKYVVMPVAFAAIAFTAYEGGRLHEFYKNQSVALESKKLVAKRVESAIKENLTSSQYFETLQEGIERVAGIYTAQEDMCDQSPMLAYLVTHVAPNSKVGKDLNRGPVLYLKQLLE
ncbi:MAG: hypothetical protein ACP5N3_03015 [Candidatus Nanoarchaeia archaeon]